MAEALKNVYNQSFFEEFIKVLKKVYPNLNQTQFLTDIYIKDWECKELKQRMYHISETMYQHLPNDYFKAVGVIIKITELLNTKEESLSFEYMFLPDYIEKYGIDDYTTSIMAIEKITQFTSCEFAVRPFIIKYPQQMILQLLVWSQHPHAMVRRLASEGSRPRLPWAMALPKFKKDPSPIIPILENLKNDPSEMVRRSVANNMNDISKDNPTTVIELVKKWQGKTKETDWLIKHASRTLLKSGNTDILDLFGFGSIAHIKVTNFQTHTPKIKIGQSLFFSFKLHNSSNSSSKIRLEYGIYYKKANGTLSRKVFKISEKIYEANTITEIQKKQSFKIITTRKFYKGQHRLSLIVNGKEFQKIDFMLIN
ncbi:DNA alkylation repair protein [Aquimarina sp. AU474]|uniref:DNA alkylation repair protein n=1 Tax=Aquimarina sp. AU474 TaxID=2108529 RepID=UPI000D69DE20|nr:DNA alkylation repair protein [Aquimarina sp. AU474]